MANVGWDVTGGSGLAAKRRGSSDPAGARVWLGSVLALACGTAIGCAGVGGCGADATSARAAPMAKGDGAEVAEAERKAKERMALVGPLVPPQRPVPRANVGAEANWPITATSVGNLHLRSKLARTAVPEGELPARYEATFYGDGQPLEGFVLDNPPVLAVVTGGPFAKWGRKNPGEPASDAIKAKAVALAKGGKLPIEMLVVSDARAKTAAGIGVGQDYAAFAKAYPQAKAPDRMPGLWEEPSCVAQQDGVWFFFDECDKLGSAHITRIVVRPATLRL